MQQHGGKRAGASRKKSHPLLQRIRGSHNLPRWMKKWIAEQTESESKLIEKAMLETYKLKEPSKEDLEEYNKLNSL